MGVPRSKAYMFVAYFDARLRPKARTVPVFVKQHLGQKTLKEFYKHFYNCVSSENERYGELYGENGSEKFYSSIMKTVQEYWGGTKTKEEYLNGAIAEIPMPEGINTPLYERWNHQHTQIYDEWKDSSDEELWSELKKILGEQQEIAEEVSQIIEKPNYAKRTIAMRRGQKKFRKKLLSLYGKCMATECEETNVLEAAHIVPYSESHDNSPENGILFRSDIHVLFDEGLMHINEEFKIVVSDKVRYEPYLNLHGKKIHFHDGLNKSQIVSNFTTRSLWQDR